MLGWRGCCGGGCEGIAGAVLGWLWRLCRGELGCIREGGGCWRNRGL